MRIEELSLRATVADYREGPREPLPQVAFAGRSNVGKSSLLNSLFGVRLAAVSKQPGKTRTLNYYLINRQLYFVDLPGYGFAKVGRMARHGWGERITAYLLGEDRIRLVVGLVDPGIPTSPLDVDLVGFVREAGKQLLVVATKADRLGRDARSKAVPRLTRELGLDRPPLLFSARTGSGRREVLAAIAAAVAV
ncbi:MAG: ribosome biogenesis GTP-binding protein YihA/YsxC [Thermoanaerobaculales bacterium]